MQVGFLGFGEAGYVISKTLLANGLGHAVAYDCNYGHPVFGAKDPAARQAWGLPAEVRTEALIEVEAI